MFGNTGWICPRCGKVHAPFVPSCDCNESVSTTGTTGTSSNQSNKCPHSWQFTGQSTVGDHYTYTNIAVQRVLNTSVLVITLRHL